MGSSVQNHKAIEKASPFVPEQGEKHERSVSASSPSSSNTSPEKKPDDPVRDVKN